MLQLCRQRKLFPYFNHITNEVLRSREAWWARHARSLLLLSICQPPVGRAPVPGVGRRCWQNPLQSPRLQGLCPWRQPPFGCFRTKTLLTQTSEGAPPIPHPEGAFLDPTLSAVSPCPHPPPISPAPAAVPWSPADTPRTAGSTFTSHLRTSRPM